MAAAVLGDKQMIELSRMLRCNPRQLEFDFGLWTRRRVRELIRRKFGIDYSEQNVGRILKMLGFSPQRPVYQALEQDEEKRRIWMEETFPAIKERAEKEGARIFFADEANAMGFRHLGGLGGGPGFVILVTVGSFCLGWHAGGRHVVPGDGRFHGPAGGPSGAFAVFVLVRRAGWPG